MKQMKHLIFPIISALAVSGCTYAQVSATPIQLPGGGEGFRYSGRSNFTYQIDESDRVMSETCAKQGRRPVVVEMSERNIGGGAIITGGSILAGANRQQDIIFRCV